MLTIKIKDTIKKYSLLTSGERVIVAVSGGPDSVCLLSILSRLAEELHLTLRIAHLDHMFRGKESADEALFVRNLAEKFGLPATIEQYNVPAFCAERGLSAQAGARDVRYAFFLRVAREFNATSIATGHTATDQAETFLMRLIRGAGYAGLSSIPPRRDAIIRPLIEITRDDVLRHLQKSGLDYVSDPSNAKSIYTRNRIRHELLPVLKTFNPRIVETLAYEAALLRDEEEAAEASLAVISRDVLLEHDEYAIIKRTNFISLPRALQRRFVRRAVDITSPPSSAALSLVQTDEAVEFMTNAQSGRVMNLPRGLTVERQYDEFIIREKAEGKGFLYAITVPGLTSIPELGLEIETILQEEGSPVRAANEENYFWQALFDYDKIGPLLQLRSRVSGDRFCPSGMAGKSKKLQDYFVDEKVPRQKRDTLPLLVSGDEVLWVVGFRTDDRFLPRPDTKRLLTVQVRTIDLQL